MLSDVDPASMYIPSKIPRPRTLDRPLIGLGPQVVDLDSRTHSNRSSAIDFDRSMLNTHNMNFNSRMRHRTLLKIIRGADHLPLSQYAYW